MLPIVMFALGLAAGDAASLEDQRAACKAVMQDTSFDACTAVLQSGQLTGHDLAAIYIDHGIGYARHLKYDLANQDFTAAIAIDPTYVAAYINRGSDYMRLNDEARAIADFDKAAALKPSDGIIFNNRCEARAHWGQELNKAEDDCTQALALLPAQKVDVYFTSLAYSNRALVRLERGDNPGALADARASLSLAPRSSRAHYLLGVAEVRTGDKAAGEAEIKDVTAADPAIAGQMGVTP